MQRSTRNQQGATMGLIVICSFVLVLLIIGLFEIHLLMGGSQELRNGVDAGALNVGKQACNDVSAKVVPLGGSFGVFGDVADRSGHIGLNNINRSLGKAFLINANVQAMSDGGFGSSSASAHASEVSTLANALCTMLYLKLNDDSVTKPFFNTYINASSVRMLGKEAAIEADSSGWDTACIDRDEESNLRVDPNQLPPGFTLSSSDTKTINEKTAPYPTQFFRGYRPYNINGRNSFFIPFKYDEKPHLISPITFNAGKAPVSGWIGPAVPNAFSTRGRTTKQKAYPNTAMSYVVSNPQLHYQLAIPHAFIHIKIDDNDVHYFVNIEPDHNSTYQSFPGQVNSNVVIHPVGSGTLNGSSVLGNEYLPPTLKQAIHALGDHPEVTQALLQRVREIKWNFSESDLSSLLSSTPLIPGIKDYYIFPTYSTADNIVPDIKCGTLPQAMAQSPWLHLYTSADGSQKEIASESKPPFSGPNIGYSTLTGSGCTPGPTFVSESGELKWTPGSGYDQCLGDLEIHRTTTIRYTGVCTVI